ncbi:MAG: ribonuclease P protein component [bacterium]
MDAKCSKEGVLKDAGVLPSATNKKTRRFGLAKAETLRGRDLFSEVFQKGNYSRGQWFDTVSLPVANGSGRVAFATTRRLRRAVDRNFVKRRLREAYRLERIGLAHIVIFIGSEKILSTEWDALRQEMRRALLKFQTACFPTS